MAVFAGFGRCSAIYSADILAGLVSLKEKVMASRVFGNWAAAQAATWMLILSASLACVANGQAVAETAGATSVSGAATSTMKPVQMPALPGTAGVPSAHVVAAPGPPPQETNVRELQAHAGKDAGKVLLRAAPVEAQIWVDGKIVGKTPMLLVLAPGKYQVEMRGARGETGKSTVDLLPRETRELVVKLQRLYPGRVTAQK